MASDPVTAVVTINRHDPLKKRDSQDPRKKKRHRPASIGLLDKQAVSTSLSPMRILQTTDPDKIRTLSLGAILACAFGVGIAFGGLAPLLSLVLENRGVDAWLIGLNSAMASVGIVLASYYSPRLIHKWGASRAMFGGTFVVFVAMGSLALFDELVLWFVLRFLLGLGLAMPWVITETWMNVVCKEESRGRVMALYTMLLAGGFALGSLVLTFVGASGALPFVLCALVFGASVLPIYLVRHHIPEFEDPASVRVSYLAKVAPTLFMAALIAGVLDTSVFSLLPVYGLRLGLGEETAVLLLTSFLLGNLVLQFPIGWCADRFGTRRALTGCALLSVAGPICAIFLFDSTNLLAAIFFIWGGASWSIYAIGLAMMGQRFRGGELAVANATFVMVFECANVVAPPTAGMAIELWEPHGLMAFLAAAAFIFLVVNVYRGMTGKA